MAWYADPAQIIAAYLMTWAALVAALGLGAAVLIALVGLLLIDPRPRAVGDTYVSNCVAFALGRRLMCGGQVRVRRSLIWWGPHFLWLPPDGGPPQQFTPIDPDGWWLLVFRGRVVEGDPPL